MERKITFEYHTNSIILHASKCLKLTLKPNIKIVETRQIYNPNFSFAHKLLQFQNIWMQDQLSWTFFSCMTTISRGRPPNVTPSAPVLAFPTAVNLPSSCLLTTGLPHQQALLKFLEVPTKNYFNCSGCNIFTYTV